MSTWPRHDIILNPQIVPGDHLDFHYWCDAIIDQFVLEIGVIPSSLTTAFKQPNFFAPEHALSTAVAFPSFN